jgi:hypothetical protein
MRTKKNDTQLMWTDHGWDYLDGKKPAKKVRKERLVTRPEDRKWKVRDYQNGK